MNFLTEDYFDYKWEFDADKFKIAKERTEQIHERTERMPTLLITEI